MTTDYMDISPAVHYLQSVRADRGSWAALFAEAVDNSLDADAKVIAMELGATRVCVADDGRGITRDRESAIVRLGEHGAMPTTKLGRFGMGIKYNALSAGDLLSVESTSSDGTMGLIVNWQQVIQSGQWKVSKPRWIPRLLSRPTGTTLTIERLRWSPPREKDVAAARDLLAQVFYPAIEQGATLLVNGVALPLLREPRLTDVVDQTVRLPNGKGAHVRGGILAEPSTLYQVQVSYKHRVILPKSIFGCGQASGLRRMFARVTLTADWGLTKFKDGLADPDALALEEAVYQVLQPMLDRCRKQQIDLKVEDITARLNDMLPEQVRARPLRKKERAEPEAHARKGKPRGATDAPPAATGPAVTQPPTGRLLLGFDEVGEEHGYGVFTRGRPNRITLASDNPLVADLLNHRDDLMAIRTLFQMAMMLYEHALEVEPGQQKLHFDAEASFGLRTWRAADRQGDVLTIAEAG